LKAHFATFPKQFPRGEGRSGKPNQVAPEHPACAYIR